ncbi:hypothetical protein ABID21_002313 [Pseudorhizobium tarimense]|uniref:Uncharacterized protein n=1 Tax=Pseudorhizobium tarimense TaxID=1079109 RepID=A0ABV2H6M0_9HYPH
MRVTVFSTKPYDRLFLDRGTGRGLDLQYCEARLSLETVALAEGSQADLPLRQRQPVGTRAGASGG